jgi:hypothetical protein
MLLSTLHVILAVALLWIIARLARPRRRRSKLPPGPPAWPVIGSVFSWPSERRWLTFTEWGRTYGTHSSIASPLTVLRLYQGDLVYVNLAGTDVIILNSLSAATTLLDKKGANFSDRPSLRFLADIVGWKEATPLMDLGPTLTGHRKRLIQVVGSRRNVDNQEDTIREAVVTCLNNMLEDPQRLLSHIQMQASDLLLVINGTDCLFLRLNTSVTLSITYGYKAMSHDDEFVILAERTNAEITSALVPGAFLVDQISAREPFRNRQISLSSMSDRFH